MCSKTHFHSVQHNDSHKEKGEKKCLLRLHRTGIIHKNLHGKILPSYRIHNLQQHPETA